MQRGAKCGLDGKPMLIHQNLWSGSECHIWNWWSSWLYLFNCNFQCVVTARIHFPFSFFAKNCANWTTSVYGDHFLTNVGQYLECCNYHVDHLWREFRMRRSFWLIPSDDRKVSMRSVKISEFWRKKYESFRNRMEGWRVDWETLNYEIHWRLVIDGWDNVREFCSLLASWDPRKRRGKRAEKGRNRNLILDGNRLTLCSHLLVLG